MNRFWKLLAERAELYGFEIDDHSFIRERQTGCCPVIAVARHLKIYGYKNTQFVKAAYELGLDMAQALSISGAADSPSHKLRKKMLRSVRLK